VQELFLRNFKMNHPNRQKRPSRRGFTLVELLVVIGIIGVLVAILIPVITKVRLSANNAATQNQMMQISHAIQNYYNDYQAYPGATADKDFNTPAAELATDPNLGINNFVTSTESLVLALMGGTDFGATPGVFVFRDDPLGKGPISRNPLTPGQKSPYMDLRPGMLSPVSKVPPTGAPTLRYLKDAGEWLSYVSGDSHVPEFIDQYSDFRPILYIRANPKGVRRLPPPSADANSLVNFGNNYDANAYYNMRSIRAYVRPYDAAVDTNPSNPRYDIFFPSPTKPADQTAVNNYFAGQLLNTTDGKVAARGAGSYILISPGNDRRYGTTDDIIFTGGGGQ
jgi:prepilin-type N-terminal cleavage/methylation domain-containing protein